MDNDTPKIPFTMAILPIILMDHSHARIHDTD
ncbi:hypothetical protein ACOMICROBIO_EPCKBFOG_03903 [Vibrio sp. B1FLJ16]|nr:hypothetical protein ACOMICROBIO_EPCKBFOG_03903 [Vibrio sp. B1FLJ16]CAD7822038.1 hypothetical protein ACOMICROBIO_FLGHMIGD_02931 [Vibrio sp. B1FLJ16]CAE6943604.1 hypothetical protein ACOMICROBIO_EPCKBFOG_03903 [Vibrio sp. B1FLJ16]CAE6947921.1 hypothetical protein ACOMICROBIO_FLGHMIGD_02931 [Vibrio sp. B1FLJ16]